MYEWQHEEQCLPLCFSLIRTVDMVSSLCKTIAVCVMLKQTTGVYQPGVLCNVTC